MSSLGSVSRNYSRASSERKPWRRLVANRLPWLSIVADASLRSSISLRLVIATDMVRYLVSAQSNPHLATLSPASVRGVRVAGFCQPFETFWDIYSTQPPTESKNHGMPPPESSRFSRDLQLADADSSLKDR